MTSTADPFPLTLEQQARLELEEEAWREEVALAKERIKAHMARPWYVRLFPYRLPISSTPKSSPLQTG